MTTSVGVLVQYLSLALAWGSSFLFIKVGLEELTPPQLVIGRLVAGALTLGVVAAVTRQRLPTSPRAVAHIAVVSVFLCVLPFSLFAWAELSVSSGLASIYNAVTPLATAAVALVALSSERLRTRSAIGLVVGLAGVLVVLAPWQPGAASGGVAGQAACLLATVSYGIGFVHLRRFVAPMGMAPVPVATVQVGIAALLVGVAAPWTATGAPTPSAPVVLAVLALGVVGTGLAYVWNTSVVAQWGATTASTVTYLTPVVGVALGVVVLGESVSWNQPAGAALVVVGIVVGRGRSGQDRARTTGSSTSTGTPVPG